MRKRFSSIATLSALFLIVGVMAAAPAFAATTCTIGPSDFETLNVTVDPNEGARIVRVDSTVEADDDKIIVTTSAGTSDLCPNGQDDFHTVFDIDTIDVTGTGALAIDLSGGDFAPGFSTETGTDEIEFYVASGLALTIQGTAGVDTWSFGQKATSTGPAGVGLNTDSDPDILGHPGPNSPLGASVTANGLAGNDNFVQDSKAAEALNGGAGTDTVDYSARIAALTVTVGDLTANDGESGELDNVGADVERILGGTANDMISVPTASTTNFRLEGGAGNDVLTGGAGRDTLLGDAGDDDLFGLAGRDLLNGGLGADDEDGGTGSDIFDQERVSNGGDNLIGGTDADGKDLDRVKYNLRSASVTVTAGAGTDNDGAASEGDDVAADIEKIYGGTGDDLLTAATGGSKLYGGAGNDTLTGLAGNDRLVGGAGNDTAIGGDGNDYLSGGSGNDRLFGRDGKDNLNGGSDDDTMNGEADSDRVSGGSGKDILWGDGNNPKVKDTLVGGSQPSGQKDTCERDLKDIKSGCEGRAGGTPPTS